MNVRVLARKLLGRRGVFALRKLLSSISLTLGFIKPANTHGRKEGISAIVCTLNEADWVEPSLLSVKDLVNEYIVMDSSIDETPNIIMRLSKEYGLNIKLFRVPPGNIVKTRNEALKHVSYRWVLIWDADFIAKPEMPKVIKDLIGRLNDKCYYLIYWPHIQLCGDLHHLCPNPLHIEHWMYTWSPYIRYEWVGRFDSLHAPVHIYQAVMIRKPLSFHLARVRSPQRIALNSIWWRFREEFNKVESWEEFLKLAKRKALKVFGTDDLEAIGKELIKKHVSRLRKYDKNTYGDYPPILKEYVKRKYGINL